VYPSLKEAAGAIWNVSLNVAAIRVSVGYLVIAAAIVYASFVLSRLFQKLVVDQELSRRGLDKGVRLSMGKLIHYALLLVGFLLALMALGFNFTNITIIVSALGVGIGFGMQNIVNNFVSGLILLLERPVRVGDYVEIDKNWAEIKKIGLRATTLQTFDYADVIVPNAELITGRVINWTLSNRLVRVTIPVGVAYGSDVPAVRENLFAAAQTNSRVTQAPSPQVFFMGFGESSLDFELRAWIWDADYKLSVASELHEEIYRRFNEADIEIAFPQRDLHLRSVDESVPMKQP
jgi:small-conductance mechanosensitive channel